MGMQSKLGFAGEAQKRTSDDREAEGDLTTAGSSTTKSKPEPKSNVKR